MNLSVRFDKKISRDIAIQTKPSLSAREELGLIKNPPTGISSQTPYLQLRPVRPDDFALIGIPGYVNVENKTKIMDENLSREVFDVLQKEGYLDQAGFLTEKFNPEEMPDKANDMGVDKMGATKLPAFMGIPRQFSLCYTDIFSILRAISQYNKILLHSKPIPSVPEIKPFASQIFWLVKVENKNESSVFVVHLHAADSNYTSDKDNYEVSYNVYVTPLKSFLSGNGKIDQDNYNGYTVLHFDKSNHITHDFIPVGGLHEGRIKKYPWLFGFLLEKYAGFSGLPLIAGHPSIAVSLEEALDQSLKTIDTSGMDFEFITKKHEQRWRTNYGHQTVYESILYVLKPHGFLLPNIVDFKDIIKDEENVVYVAWPENPGEDALSLMEAASYDSRLRIFIVDPESLNVVENEGGEKFVSAIPLVVFDKGKPVILQSPKPVLLNYSFSSFYNQLYDENNKPMIPLAAHRLQKNFTDIKLMTFIALQQQGVRVSSWQALNSSRPLQEIESSLELFLSTKTVSEGVAKPVTGRGGKGILFFDSSNVTKVAGAIIRNPSKMDYVLQERIIPPLIEENGKKMDWNFRVFISPDQKGRLPKVVRIGEFGKAINISIDARPALIEEVANRLGWSKETMEKLDQDVDALTRQAFKAINQTMLATKALAEGENAVDFMGVDIIVRMENGELVPYVMEVNDHHSGAAWDLDQALKKAAGVYISQEEAKRRLGEAREGGLKSWRAARGRINWGKILMWFPRILKFLPSLLILLQQTKCF